MRQALEIAWTNAYLFSGHPPHLLVVDDINFIKPVEIGLFYCILFYS
jgi:acyl-CoA hydrolase